MKSTRIATRAGTFRIIVAVRGPRAATPRQLKHALNVALNRIERSERRQQLLRIRRAKKGSKR